MHFADGSGLCVCGISNDLMSMIWMMACYGEGDA